MPDCLDNIIGLTDVECECYAGDLPEDWAEVNVSETGFYLTDPEFGFPIVEEINATGNCGGGTLYDMLETARNKAIKAFRADLGMAIMKRHRNVVQFRGTIGKLESNSRVRPAEDYVGVQLLPRPLRDGKFVLEAIYLGLSVADTVAVTIATNEGNVDTPLFTPVTVDITTQANKFVRKELDTPLELPFFQMTNAEDLRYLIYYTPPAGASVLSNRFTCCSKSPAWRQHIQAHGLSTNDITEFEPGKLGNAMGVVLEGYTVCNEVGWLCRLDQIGGYSVKQLAGRAIQHKGGAFLVSGILDSAQINRYTLKPKEELYARRDYLQKEYMNAVDWIANNLPSEALDCLECKSANRHQVRQMIV